MTCRVEDAQIGCNSEVERWVMPFHVATLTIVAEIISIVIAFVAVAREQGSARRAFLELLAPEPLLAFTPIGVVYGLGDFLQTVACNVASAPVIIIVGQSKLIIAAIMSKVFINSLTPTNWLRLVLISCAAAAGADIGAASPRASIRELELTGALMAFAKAFLSSTGAVISERIYKQASGAGFWVVSFRVQLMMLLTSIALLPLTAHTWQSMSLEEFFQGGPLPLCSHFEESRHSLYDGEMFVCVDRRGWDMMTLFSALGLVINGMTTGLVLQNLSAVAKSICNALSSAVFYALYVLLGFRSFTVAQACIFAVVVISSYEYSMEKATASFAARQGRICSSSEKV